MSARLPLALGSSDQRGDNVTDWQRWAKNWAQSYAGIMGPIDGYYGNSEAAFVREMQHRLSVPQTGVFDDQLAALTGYAKRSAEPAARRKIWLYSAPGSGADWNVGPSFEVGEWCKDVLKINHQPIGYPKGGYLGLMGGDPRLSYLDVIAAEGAELERLLDANPDINDPDIELWFSGYSQSADGMEDAVERLFGDSGVYAHLRARINGLIQFGNPSRQEGPTKVGNNPPGWGIARKRRPKWLADLTWSITTQNDFYAAVAEEIRPLFYEWFIRAETEIPFVVYCAQIIIPALLNLIAPGMSAASPIAAVVLAGATGAPVGVLGSLLGSIGSTRQKPNPKLIELLSIKGFLTNIPALITLIAALPGLQSHGEYHLPKPEFGGRTGIQVGCDVIAAFRR